MGLGSGYEGCGGRMESPWVLLCWGIGIWLRVPEAVQASCPGLLCALMVHKGKKPPSSRVSLYNILVMPIYQAPSLSL